MREQVLFTRIDGWLYTTHVISWLCKKQPWRNRYKVRDKVYKGTVNESDFDKIDSKKTFLATNINQIIHED